MKIRNYLLSTIALMLAVFFNTNEVSAQQYKLHQATMMMGMKSESTIYVKGMRKRTEGGGYAGMPNNLITIEQCDLQRTITLNDKKKLYYIEPFSKELEEIIDEDEKPAAKKPVPSPAKTDIKKGGTITMWYNITDTGERKKMFGLTARHIWTTQKMIPSADACMMKDSMIIKTDGWYIDLPEFKCPVRYAASTNALGSGVAPLECQDKYITRRSGKGKLGFPLIEKRTMIMGNRAAESSNFEMNLETIELSTGKLDSMLFEIPVGYALAKNREELQDKMDAAAMMEQYANMNKQKETKQVDLTAEKGEGVIRIGVIEPAGSGELQAAPLQVHLVNLLATDKIQAVAVASADEAKKLSCDLLLTTQFTQVKQAGKLGGLLKAIKNADPSSATSYNVEAKFLLSNLTDDATRIEKKVSGKFDGTADAAAKKALEDGSRMLLKELKK